MTILLAFVKLAVLLAAGWFVTSRAIPWAWVRLTRALGFKARLTPINQKRITRFQRIKRGYWSFQAITTLFVISLFLELLVNGKALVIHYEGHTAFPAVAQWLDRIVPFTDISAFQKKSDFGQTGDSEVDYRRFARWSEDPAALRAEAEASAVAAAADRKSAEAEAPAAGAGDFQKRKHQQRLTAVAKKEAEAAQYAKTLAAFERGDAWIVMPLYRYGPSDLRLDMEKNPPNAPSLALGLPLGTDQAGRDVVPLMLYGFRLSLSFALLVAAVGEAFGIVVGGIQGYFGGWVDILSQRFVEIWGSIPFLFVMMILASMITPKFLVMAAMLVVLRSWIGITYYVRGEFYREKSKDYVQAAIGTGVSDWKIITRHILPNSIVPIVTFTPFAIVGFIGSLVSLDYLGFGLPPGTPSWGALLRQGLENVQDYPHLTIVPTLALASTLYAVVMIGEAVREAFDPKVFSRLR